MTSLKAKTCAALCSLALALSLPIAVRAQQAQPVPKFIDYPVQVMRSRKAPLTLDRDAMRFRTRYRNLYESAPNFAGHFAVTGVGCGFGCVFLLAVDLRTGKPVSLGIPAGENLDDCTEEYRDADGMPVDKGFYFRANSRLFVVTGQMPGNACGARFYEERGGQLHLIREVRLEKVA